MFSLNRKQTRLRSDSEDILVRYEKDDATPVSRVKIRDLVVHSSGGLTLPNAVNYYLTSGHSRHLLVEQTGKVVVQMLDFNQRANHAQGFDKRSLAVELIYMGKLTEAQGYPYSRSRFDPHEMIYAHSINESREYWWPLFPQNQMDTLLEITRTLNQAFGFESILIKDEIDEINFKIGPAFPRSRLRQLLLDTGESKDLLEETASPAELFAEPGGDGRKILEEPLPAHTSVVVVQQNGEWALVEVMAEVSGQRWLVGWIETAKVTVPVFTPGVSGDHKLTAGLANRNIKFVEPAKGNFNPSDDLNPRYIVIHFSTGTDFRSTIHHFLNPNSGVSAHLLLARSGLVVQFVPFNRIAYHVGPSYWEGKKYLNPLAIGIEVDNAGYLKSSRRRGFTSQYGVPIPIDQVGHRTHWSENHEKPWQKFPDNQIRVLEKIVRALLEKYPSIQEIVGHDMVNLINRLDPGPLFPLGDLRQALLGDPQPGIVRLATNQECPVYENISDNPPFDVNHAKWGILPKRSKVRIRNGEVYPRWTKVVVKESTPGRLIDKEGWVRSNSIEPDDSGRALTKVEQPLYKVIASVEPRFPPVVIRTLPKDRLLRKLFDKNEKWMLVAPVLEEVVVEENGVSRFELRVTPDMQKFKFNEGWIDKQFLK